MLPGCGADLDLLTRRVLIRTPAQHAVIGFFDTAGGFGPEILTLKPLAFTGCGLAAKFGIVDEQVEHALKICLVSAVDGEAGAVDRFIIFRNIAGQHADTGRHGIEKSQRQALKLRRKHEQSGMGLTNRGVAVELGLSEHTIKKYLLRIFDKVGISSRVELVLYPMSHGEHRPAEWRPSGIA